MKSPIQSLMKQVRGKLSGYLLAAFLFGSGAAWALDLEAAKSQGLVGEQPNGYIAAVKPGAEVDKLVVDINGKREDAYVRLAQKNNIEVSKIGALAGKKLIEKSKPGQFVRLPNGQWQQL